MCGIIYTQCRVSVPNLGHIAYQAVYHVNGRRYQSCPSHHFFFMISPCFKNYIYFKVSSFTCWFQTYVIIIRIECLHQIKALAFLKSSNSFFSIISIVNKTHIDYHIHRTLRISKKDKSLKNPKGTQIIGLNQPIQLMVEQKWSNFLTL